MSRDFYSTLYFQFPVWIFIHKNLLLLEILDMLKQHNRCIFIFTSPPHYAVTCLSSSSPLSLICFLRPPSINAVSQRCQTYHLYEGSSKKYRRRLVLIQKCEYFLPQIPLKYYSELVIYSSSISFISFVDKGFLECSNSELIMKL